ncbi:MAG: hypothetical protein IK016_01715 [Lachnospiraceae bacterium]|nr:hypothetical protein [Lachnospiraceae bacterium]
MNIELSRFRVKEGRSKTVDEWMAFLNENMSDVLLTLDGERMHVETIFREKSGDAEYLYWYSIQSEGGQTVAQSESWIDKRHLEFWDQCIDNSSQVDMTMVVSMIPQRVLSAMNERRKHLSL